MLRLLFMVFMGGTLISNAQVVSIPDPVFKSRLVNHLPIIDTNADGEIQVSEALAFSGNLEVAGTPSDPNGILDLTGLEAFENLLGFNGSHNPIQHVDFSNNVLLEDIVLNETDLVTINVQQNSALRTLNMTGNDNLLSLDVSNKPDLLLLQANLSGLSNLNVSNCPNLQFLYVQANQLETISLESLPSLIILNAGSNLLSAIDLLELEELVFLKLDDNLFTDINVSGNENLIQLDVRANKFLTYINLRNGNNENMDSSGGNNSCNFENTPALQEVCVDALDTALTHFIQDQTTQTVSFATECALGISTNNLQQISLYPNPNHGTIYLNNPSIVLKATVYNTNGLKIKVIETRQTIDSFDINELPDGNYFIQLVDTHGYTHMKKLIKN